MSLVKYANDPRVTKSGSPAESGEGFYFQHNGIQYLVKDSGFLGWSGYTGPDLEMVTYGAQSPDEAIDLILEVS